MYDIFDNGKIISRYVPSSFHSKELKNFYVYYGVRPQRFKHSTSRLKFTSFLVSHSTFLWFVHLLMLFLNLLHLGIQTGSYSVETRRFLRLLIRISRFRSIK